MNVSLMFIFSGNFQFETGLLIFWIDGYFIFCRNQFLHLALSDFITSNSFARLLTIVFEALAFI